MLLFSQNGIVSVKIQRGGPWKPVYYTDYHELMAVLSWDVSTDQHTQKTVMKPVTHRKWI